MTRTQDCSFTTSMPYPEGALTHLTNFWNARGVLERTYVPSKKYSRAISQVLSSISASSPTAKRLRKGVDLRPNVTEVAPELEALRLFHRFRSGSESRTLSMLRVKKQFDRTVASKLPPDTQVIVAMPGSSLRTFQSASRNTLKVFHEVDAPPLAHNSALLNFYKRGDVLGEIYPDELVSRIEDELSAANVVLSPSNVVTRELLASGIRPEVIFNAPYGVDFSRFLPTPSAKKSSNSVVRLVYVGQISRRKGIGFLLDAARNLRVDIELIGPIVDRRILASLPTNVHYRGVLPHDEVNRALAEADAFVFPSVEDACPLAVIEAAGAGLPVLVTSSTGSAELLENCDRTLVAPGDVAALRSAMASVVPLSWSEREQRAARVRRSGPENKIVSWGQYTEIVGAELQRRFAGHKG